jgi:hypothetical protein
MIQISTTAEIGTSLNLMVEGGIDRHQQEEEGYNHKEICLIDDEKRKNFVKIVYRLLHR